MTRNANIRFMTNNLLQADASTVTASGAVAGFPASNAYAIERWKRWRLPGTFRFASTEAKLYINDGADKTVTLTADVTYADGAELAAHVEASLNAASTDWTCTYNEVAGAYLFKIARSAGTAQLRLSEQADAAWDLLGFTGAVDLTAGPFTAAEQRNHHFEWLDIDAGSPARVRAVLMGAPSGQNFALSSAATVRILGNSIADFSAPPLDVTLSTADRLGVQAFLDDLADSTYRYWRVWIRDRTNPAGPNLDLGKVYVGDFVELTERNLNRGFRKTLVDPSEVSKSDSGVPFFRRKLKFWRYDSMQIEHLENDEREEMESMVEELGIDTPFWIAIDPLQGISYAPMELTRYVRFTSDFDLQHIIYNKFTLSFSVEEII